MGRHDAALVHSRVAKSAKSTVMPRNDVILSPFTRQLV
jgi:hypothetical protein